MDGDYIEKVTEYCHRNNIEIKKVKSRDVKEALKNMKVSDTKRSYIKTILQSYQIEDIECIISGKSTIAKMYRNRDIKNRRTFEDAIQALFDSKVNSVDCYTGNTSNNEIGRLFQSSKVLYNLYNKGKINIEEYANLLNKVFTDVSFNTPSSFIKSQKDKYDHFDIGLYEKDSFVKIFIKDK